MRWGRKVLGLLAIAGLLLGSSCANPTSPPPQEPQVSFNDLELTLAGTGAANGFYRENGTNEGKPKYSQAGGSYFLYYLNSSSGFRWVIHTSILTAGTDLAAATYNSADTTAETTPTGGWGVGSGTAPAPTVAREAVTGTLADGNELTGVYNYSDAQGDLDVSTYQWKRSATLTGTYSDIAGATGTTYLLDAADSDQFLRLEVTPRDDSGAIGTPVLSGAAKIAAAGANTAPQVSFYDVEVTLAGTIAARGYYRETGANESRPKYNQVSGTYFLYYFTSIDFGTRWAIHDTVFGTSTNNLDEVHYHNSETTSQTAPTSTWNRTALGTSPPPTVARVAITGPLSEGNVLTGVYNYSDTEGDADASTYQWKSYASSTDTGAGTDCTGDGATTLNYTVAAGDSGRYLRLEVTPEDARGAIGTAVLSGSVRIN